MKRKLLDTVGDKIRFKHYSYQTEKAYVGWIKQFIFFHNKRHPIEMGKTEIKQFLTHCSIQEQLGHKSVETTMIYTHIVAEMNKGRVVIPLDM